MLGEQRDQGFFPPTPAEGGGDVDEHGGVEEQQDEDGQVEPEKLVKTSIEMTKPEKKVKPAARDLLESEFRPR